MKKQTVKYYFINCRLKFTRSQRNVDSVTNIVSFSYTGVDVEDCLVITSEGKKSIEYVTTVGAVIKHNICRVRKHKFVGDLVSKEKFMEVLRQRKFEVFECIESIHDEKIKALRDKEFFEFPIK